MKGRLAASDSTRYNSRIEELRQRELRALAEALYLDTAACPPVPASAIRAYTEDVASTFYSNPHSHSPSAVRTADLVAEVRKTVLRELFCINSGWSLVFTSGATASLKLVADAFDFGPDDAFILRLASHTSLAGLRGHLAARGVPTLIGTKGHGLVATPLQCNATGARFEPVPSSTQTAVLLDAASFLSSSSRLPLPNSSDAGYDAAPDFVAFSFYKLFGAPTGLGGLLIKSASLHKLCCKTYYGGGSLSLHMPISGRAIPRAGTDALEDGTLNVHAIVQLKHSIAAHHTLLGDWAKRKAHTNALDARFHSRLRSLRHANGTSLLRLVGSTPGGGPIAAFVVLQADGTRVPTSEISRLASLCDIHLRVGRHCNAGAAVTHLLDGDEAPLWDAWQRGTGCDSGDEDRAASVRISWGVWNIFADVDRFVQFLETHFATTRTDLPLARTPTAPARAAMQVKAITLYPIKSCAGQEVESWRLTPYGLAHDREWCLVDLSTGRALSQKSVPKMATIRAAIRNEQLVVQLGADHDAETLRFPVLDERPVARKGTTTRVCGDTVQQRVYDDADIIAAFSRFLGRSCTLARLPPDSTERHAHNLNAKGATSSVSTIEDGQDGHVPVHAPLLLANESPYLVLYEDSVRALADWLEQDGHARVGWRQLARHFRANMIIGRAGHADRNAADVDDDQRDGGGLHTLAEDAHERLELHSSDSDGFGGSVTTFTPLGACRRCQMVAIDPDTGALRPETLISLSKRRRGARGRVEFGVHFACRPRSVGAVVSVGDIVR